MCSWHVTLSANCIRSRRGKLFVLIHRDNVTVLQHCCGGRKEYFCSVPTLLSISPFYGAVFPKIKLETASPPTWEERQGFKVLNAATFFRCVCFHLSPEPSCLQSATVLSSPTGTLSHRRTRREGSSQNAQEHPPCRRVEGWDQEVIAQNTSPKKLK